VNALEDARGARRRLAWDHAKKAQAIAHLLECDPDAIIYDTPLELATIADWTAFTNADREYRALKDQDDQN
jgi:hypothetical protein